MRKIPTSNANKLRAVRLTRNAAVIWATWSLRSSDGTSNIPAGRAAESIDVSKPSGRIRSICVNLPLVLVRLWAVAISVRIKVSMARLAKLLEGTSRPVKWTSRVSPLIERVRRQESLRAVGRQGRKPYCSAVETESKIESGTCMRDAIVSDADWLGDPRYPRNGASANGSIPSKVNGTFPSCGLSAYALMRGALSNLSRHSGSVRRRT
jgi:hypothetical protein